MNKKIRNAFNNIKVDNDLSKRILNETIYKTENKQRNWKLFYTIIAILFISILSLVLYVLFIN